MNKLIYLFLISIIIFSSCDDMNSINQEWIDRGETIYTGAVDSLEARPGNNRLRLVWQMNADPRIEELIILWNNKQDSIILPVVRDTEEKIGIHKDSVLIDQKLEEGSAVFQFYTRDNIGHTSVVKELTTEIYGENYANATALRTPRRIEAIELLNTTTAKVIFDAIESLDMKETKLQYNTYEENETGVVRSILVSNDEDFVLLENIKLGDPILSQSYFLPTVDALDGFLGKEFITYIPDMILPSTGSYEIIEDSGSWCDYGWDWPGNMDGKGTYLNNANADQKYGDGKNCYVTKLGVEGTAWGLGLKINEDYSITVYMAQFNGDWINNFVHCKYTPEKCYFDPDTGIVHFDYDVLVDGAWNIKGETHMKLAE